MSSTSDQPQWEIDDGVWILAGEHAGSAGTVHHVEDDTVYVEVAAGKQYDVDAFAAMVAADDLVPYV